MNILIPDSWLREYLKTNATPAEIKRYLSLCGPSVERLEKIQGEYVYDIEVTTNRVDSASVMGIAREAVAILPRFGKKATLKDSSHLAIKPFSHKENFPLKITVHDGLCSRIMAIILDNVQLKDSSTLIKKRLKQVGINSINNAVDMTNYVMVEIGQPTHVFDFDLVAKGEFIIRKARKGEKIIDLHGVSYTLNGERQSLIMEMVKLLIYRESLVPKTV